MSLLLHCPACGETFDLREARNDQAWREFIDTLVQLPAVVQPALLQYLELFRPAQQPAVRSSTALKLTTELLPLIKAQRLERKHTCYDVPHALWANAMSYLVGKRTTLSLPLKGNGYLFETIANQCEKRAAKAEEQTIVNQRHPQAKPLKAEPTPLSHYVQAAIPATPAPASTGNGFSRLADVMREALSQPNTSPAIQTGETA